MCHSTQLTGSFGMHMHKPCSGFYDFRQQQGNAHVYTESGIYCMGSDSLLIQRREENVDTLSSIISTNLHQECVYRLMLPEAMMLTIKDNHDQGPSFDAEYCSSVLYLSVTFLFGSHCKLHRWANLCRNIRHVYPHLGVASLYILPPEGV